MEERPDFSLGWLWLFEQLQRTQVTEFHAVANVIDSALAMLIARGSSRQCGGPT